MFSRYKKPTGGKPSLVEVSTEKPESAAVAEAPAQVQRRPAAHRKQPVVTPGQVVPMDKEKKRKERLSEVIWCLCATTHRSGHQRKSRTVGGPA